MKSNRVILLFYLLYAIVFVALQFGMADALEADWGMLNEPFGEPGIILPVSVFNIGDVDIGSAIGLDRIAPALTLNNRRNEGMGLLPGVTSEMAAFSLNYLTSGIPESSFFINSSKIRMETINNKVKSGSFNAPALVPEPVTMLLVGAGLLGLALYLRRHRK